MRYLYNLLLYLILPLLPLRLLWKSRANSSYRQRIGERFSWFKFPARHNSIWIHAVSVGEAAAAIPLINQLLSTFPNNKIVMTTMTPTGAAYIQKIFPHQVLQLYVPYDYPLFIKRFLSHIDPKILILMESELWPNILHYTHKRKVPIVVANARLSTKSFLRYHKVRPLLKPLFASFTTVATQSNDDAARFINLGLDPKKIVVTNNIKFDINIPSHIAPAAHNLRALWGQERPVWIAASTHKGEEAKILTAAKIVTKTIPQALLIIVPRHPERFTEVFALAQKQDFNTIYYSAKDELAPTTNLIVGDVMGQLLLLYAASDIAFVGGSLVAWGGHNLLEPAALAKPVVAGKNLESFLEVSQLMLDHKALIQVADEFELAHRVIQLFKEQSLRDRVGAAALDVVETHRGATQKILTHIMAAITR